MSFRNRLIVGVALLSGLAFLPAQAHADQIDFLGVGRNSTVSIGDVCAGTFAAGELNWQWIGTCAGRFRAVVLLLLR